MNAIFPLQTGSEIEKILHILDNLRVSMHVAGDIVKISNSPNNITSPSRSDGYLGRPIDAGVARPPPPLPRTECFSLASWVGERRIVCVLMDANFDKSDYAKRR